MDVSYYKRARDSESTSPRMKAMLEDIVRVCVTICDFAAEKIRMILSGSHQKSDIVYCSG